MKFLKKIFSPFLLTFSFLLLFYIFFKSKIYFDEKTQDYYLIYYYVSLILIIFSIISFFLNQKIKEYLVIFFISLIIGLYLFEASFFLKKQNSKTLNLKDKLFEKQTGKKWDKRKTFEIYQDLKKTNSKITVSVYPDRFLDKNLPILPFSGISNSQTIYCNENGNYSIYQSDRYGFNNPDEEWNENEIEYLLVGDSYVKGACVNRPNDIGSSLRYLSSKSVLNLGQGGIGPLIEYAILREYMKNNVKKVLWFYYEGNDIKELLLEKKNNILNHYLNNSKYTQDLKFKQKEIDKLLINFIKKEEVIYNKKIKVKKNKNFISNFIKFIKITNTRRLLIYSTSSKAKSDEILLKSEFKNILHLSKKLVEENSSQLFFIYLPEFSRYKFKNKNFNYNVVKDIVKELDIPFIDIHGEVFKKNKNPLKFFPYELNGHYNSEGYKKVSEFIYQFSKE